MIYRVSGLRISCVVINGGMLASMVSERQFMSSEYNMV